MTRCPKCSTVPDSGRLTELMNRFGFIGRGQRLTCAGCGTRLSIRAAPANLFWAALLALIGLLLIWAVRLPNNETMAAVLLAVALFALFLHYRFTPRLIGLELSTAGEALPPLQETPGGPPVPWRCGSCQEQNPAGFEICSKCGAAWDQRAEDN